MEVPIEILLSQKPIRQGFTFRGYLPPAAGIEHVCIVINNPAANDSDTIYFIITSQRDSVIRRYRYDPYAYFEIDKKEAQKYFHNLKDKSIIPCGKVDLLQIKKGDLINGLKSGALKFEENISDTTMQQIIDTMGMSNTFTQEEIIALTS